MSKIYSFSTGKDQIYPTEYNSIDTMLISEDKLLKIVDEKFPVIIELVNKISNISSIIL